MGAFPSHSFTQTSSDWAFLCTQSPAAAIRQVMDTEALIRFYAAAVQGMSAQACDGACSEALKRLADVALSAWPGRQLSRTWAAAL